MPDMTSSIMPFSRTDDDRRQRVSLCGWANRSDEYGIGNGTSLIIMAESCHPRCTRTLLIDRVPTHQGIDIRWRGRAGRELWRNSWCPSSCSLPLLSLSWRSPWAKADPHAIGKACSRSTRLWRHAPFLPEGKSGGYAGDLRQQLADVPDFIFTFCRFNNCWVIDACSVRAPVHYNLFYIRLIYFFCYFGLLVIFNPEGHGQ